MDADGRHQRRLTETDESEADPVWSPDGKLIAFSSQADPCWAYGCDYGVWAAWVVRPDGSGLRRVGEELGDGRGRYPRWSPDGSRLAFETNIGSDGDASSIGVAQVSGGGWELPVRESSWLSWSPNGRRIAYFGLGIRVTHVRGSSSGVLVRRGIRPEWSPTRNLIAFQKGTPRVRVISSRGGRITRLPSATRFAWERNGRRLILFRSDGDIREVDSDGRHLRVILRKPGELATDEERVTPWATSPDDRRVYYAAIVR